MAEFQRLLVPHDFSKHADGALKVAARLVGRGGKLVVLHVVVPFVPMTDIAPTGVAGRRTSILPSSRASRDDSSNAR